MAKIKSDKKNCKDTRYHDTQLLFRKYREILWSLTLETAALKRDFQSEYGETIDRFLEDIYSAGANLNGTDIEDRARSIARSKKMLDLIDEAVNLVRNYCENGEELYQILYLSYMQPKKISNEDILSELQKNGFFIGDRTLLRHRAEAVDKVSSVLWGYTSKDSMNILNQFVK